MALDLIKEPQPVITKIDMDSPLYEEKLAVAKKEEQAVNDIVAKTSELFGAKVETLGYNMVQNGAESKLVLTLSITKKPEDIVEVPASGPNPITGLAT